MLHIWCKNIDYRALKSARREREDSTAIVLHCGRNMTCAWQVLLRADMEGFTVNGVTFNSVPAGLDCRAHIQGYITYNDGTPYPDVLLNDETVEVGPNTTQGIVFVVKVPAGFAVGSYSVEYTVRTSIGDRKLTAALVVHSAEICEPKDSEFGHEYFFSPFAVCGEGDEKYEYRYNPYYGIERFSDKWWDVMAEFAKTMKEMRVNSFYLNAVTFLALGGSSRTGEKEWSFDFALLDRYTEHFLANGSFRQITLVAPITSVTGETVLGIDYESKEKWFTIYEEETEAWMTAYLTALNKHFTEKGWIDMLFMHIEDEPHTSDYWLWMRERIKKYMPTVRCMEPIDTEGIGEQIKDGCDVFIPRINVFEPEALFYNSRAAAGLNELWVYSCCYPEEPWWLNKFIDLPQHYSRFMKYACYSNDITGFLHWGFNYWTGDAILYGMHPDARFKGDGFIVYPDVERGSLRLSNRALETILGIEDWELLNSLGEKVGKETAKAISADVAKSFRVFSSDINAAENARAKVLALLD